MNKNVHIKSYYYNSLSRGLKNDITQMKIKYVFLSHLTVKIFERKRFSLCLCSPQYKRSLCLIYKSL